MGSVAGQDYLQSLNNAQRQGRSIIDDDDALMTGIRSRRTRPQDTPTDFSRAWKWENQGQFSTNMLEN